MTDELLFVGVNGWGAVSLGHSTDTVTVLLVVEGPPGHRASAILSPDTVLALIEGLRRKRAAALEEDPPTQRLRVTQENPGGTG